MANEALTLQASAVFMSRVSKRGRHHFFHGQPGTKEEGGRNQTGMDGDDGISLHVSGFAEYCLTGARVDLFMLELACW